MRRLFRYSLSLAWTLGVLCCGCGESDTDDPLPPPDRPYLTLAQEPVTAYPAAGGEGKLVFSTSEAWEVLFEPAPKPEGTTADDTAEKPWYAASPLSGLAGKDIAVSITIQSNPTYFPRGAVLVLRSKSLEKRFEITQAKKNVILLGDNRRAVGSGQQTLTVEVQSNVDYAVTIKTGGGWIGELPESRAAPGLEERTHRFAVSANPNALERTGVIVFTDKDSDLSDELTLVQAAWEDPDPERSALQALYDAAGGGGWTRNDNWGSDKPLGEWHGVETDSEGRVIALRLPNNNLSGAILKHVGKLTSLRHVDLSHNALEEDLDFYDGETSKWRSHLDDLLELETINLSHNRLTAGTPIGWSQMKNLRYVDLSSNCLTGTPIPIQWEPLYPDGTYIDVVLNDNYYDGTINAFIRNHTQWSRIALQFIRQKMMVKGDQGVGGLDCENVFLPDFTFTDLRNGTQHAIRDIYSANKLTMLVQWDPTDADSNLFIETTVRRFHTLYGPQGFGVAAFVREGDEYRQAAERYLQTHDVAWPVVAEYADAEGKRVILPTEPYPGYLLIEQSGEVSEDMFKGKRIVDPLDYSRTPPPTADLAGRPFEIIDQLNAKFNKTFGYCTYESTDYSMDKRTEILQKSTRGEGIDIVLIGDAFTDVDIETGFYREVMEFAMESFFGLEPTKSYREYFNVHLVNAVSKNAHIGYWGDGLVTALGVLRKTPGWFETYQAEKKLPEYYTQAVKSGVATVGVIINNTIGGVTYMQSYGMGPCYAFNGYVYGNRPDLRDTFTHETAGHGFGLLGDEYAREGGQELNSLRTAQSKGWHLNLSLTNDPTKVPWSHMIGHARFPYVGVYEGGYYNSKGVWRPEDQSVMRYHQYIRYFNAPSRELIVKRIMELSGEEYTFEKFLAKDSDAGRPGKSAASALQRSPHRTDYHHQPPIMGE